MLCCKWANCLSINGMWFSTLSLYGYWFIYSERDILNVFIILVIYICIVLINYGIDCFLLVCMYVLLNLTTTYYRHYI